MNSAYACRQSAQGRNQRISGVDFLDGSFLVEVCQRFCSDAPVVVRPGTPEYYMAQALKLAKRGYGTTSPNPMVGAVLVKAGRVIGSGWHHRAGKPHAEIEAIAAARRMGEDVRGATLYVTLEPCSTHGRTPPCTEAIVGERIREVVVGATDPNPEHAGRAFARLKRAGIVVHRGVMAADCTRLNEGFNHWIVHRTPFIMVKASMTLDGKIATSSGESKWITSPEARMEAMRMRRGVDAILVGINTVVADDPSLTYRAPTKREVRARDLRRIVLDPAARIPLNKKLISDEFASLTTVVVSENAPKKRIAELRTRVNVMVCPTQRALESEETLARTGKNDHRHSLDLRWLLKRLGAEEITSLLVEGGGEANASFLMSGLAHRIAFFYAPKILGGKEARRAVGGRGAARAAEVLDLKEVEWKQIGPDLFLTARVPSKWPVRR